MHLRFTNRSFMGLKINGEKVIVTLLPEKNSYYVIPKKMHHLRIYSLIKRELILNCYIKKGQTYKE